MDEKKGFMKELEESGLKKTKHRVSLLDILYDEKQPVNADKIFIRLKEKGIDINLSTVYRNLEVLVSKGLATKLTFPGDSKALYEYNRMGHRHYIVCVECKNIMCIEYCPLHEYELSLEKETGYKINAHKLVMFGCCPDCIKKLSNNRRKSHCLI